MKRTGRRGWAKRRNLVKRGGVYYYERVLDGRRVRRSTETGDLQAAA